MSTLPLMLIGMALYRLGLFEGRLDRRKMKRWGWAGLIGGGVLALPLGLWPLSAGFPLALTEFVFNGPAALLHLPMMLGLLSLLVGGDVQEHVGDPFEPPGPGRLHQDDVGTRHILAQPLPCLFDGPDLARRPVVAALG